MVVNMHQITEMTPQDLELISLLQWAPRITWGEAGEILDVHPTTLAGRWERLRDGGAAWVTGQVTLGTHRNLMGFMQASCQPADWPRVLEKILSMPALISADAFAREPDLGLTVVTKDLNSLSRLLEEDVASLPGLSKVHTMISTKLHLSADQWRINQLSDEQREAAIAWERHEREALGDVNPTLGEEHRPVLEALMHNGRASAAEIARSTGLHPATARRYLQKVLASGVLTLRCDCVHRLCGFPVTAIWFLRVRAAEHESMARGLAKDPRARVISSMTGRSNFLAVFGLQDVAEISEVEQFIQSQASSADISETQVTLRPLKRMGWLLDEFGYSTGRFVPAHVPLSEHG